MQLVEGAILSVVPSSGEIGTNVTITGQGFLGGGDSVVAVYLAGAAAVLVDVNDTYAVVTSTFNVSFEDIILEVFLWGTRTLSAMCCSGCSFVQDVARAGCLISN